MRNASTVSIPQAVSTVATYDVTNILLYLLDMVSIPQAVSTVATYKRKLK